MTSQLHMHFTGESSQHVHQCASCTFVVCRLQCAFLTITNASWFQLDAMPDYAYTGRSLRTYRWTSGGLWFEEDIGVNCKDSHKWLRRFEYSFLMRLSP